MGNDRREFLRQTGEALAGMALAPKLLPEVRADQSSGKAAARELIRGLMVDAARVPESLDYYRRVVEFGAEWGFNTLQFRLTDDQGSALRFHSVADLVTHRDAYTPDQLKEFVEFAHRHGVDVIPEIESFGHTGYVTRPSRYAHLLDSDTHGSSEFTGIIPVVAETLDIFEKLYREVASIFPSVYVHAGCDEVNWGGSAQSRKALETKSRARVWSEYLNSLNKIAEGLGKQMIVWGDFVLRKEPEILTNLNKNIIIMDWNYWDTSAVEFHRALMKASGGGFRGIGAPALISYRWGPRPGRQQLRNIDAFAEAYCEAKEPASLGVVLTNWVPSRYIQNSLWDGFAYAGLAFKEGTAAAQLTGLRRFVEKHYGAAWDERWSEAFQLIYDAAPGMYDREPISAFALHLTVPWSSDEHLAALVKGGASRSNPFTEVRGLLVELEPMVRRNLSDFQAFSLCVDYLETALWREQVIAAGSPDEDSAKALIQTIAARDRELLERLSRDWDLGRSPDSAAKHEQEYGLEPKDQLLWQWQRATAYSSDLALRPDRFLQIMHGRGTAPAG